MYNDTIAAISTPLGEGGIGIVRLSGPRAREILTRIFVPGRRRTAVTPQPAAAGAWPPRQMRYGHVVDPESGEVIDEALAVFLPAPYTYTREDMAEIDGHGGIVPLQRILALCLRQGARLAQPGEFTARAFLNGRISLDQAEAVLDVVQARTETALRLALQQLGGRLAAQVRGIRGLLLEVLAYLTATIDFPEDEIPQEDVLPRMQEAQGRIKQLLATADQGIIYRQGIRTAIVGRPNVGKSSLLNALLRQSRAIVTPIPGTTRDTIEETMHLRGLPIVLIDTAGITATDNLVERLGVERSRQAVQAADLALFVLDGSRPLSHYDRQIAALLTDKTAIMVINKADLPQRLNATQAAGLLPDAPVVHISALTGAGLEQLEDTIEATVLGGRVVATDALLVTNPRHQDALRRAAEHLAAAIEALQQNLYADCIAIDLTAAANALGEITGETVGQDLLEAIFSRFCIGK